LFQIPVLDLFTVTSYAFCVFDVEDEEDSELEVELPELLLPPSEPALCAASSVVVVFVSTVAFVAFTASITDSFPAYTFEYVSGSEFELVSVVSVSEGSSMSF